MSSASSFPVPSKPHGESLARIPLVRQMLSDPLVRLAPRAIDQRWFYEHIVPVTLAGFNPFHRTIFYASNSALSHWLANPYGSARDYNEGDYLVREVLFAVHDYLHCWSAAAIAVLAPWVRFDTGPILRDNIEDFVFCHLLTEAAATVGLDYWYLSTFELPERIPIGTTQVNLTVSYHERYVSEYRRFYQGWDAQRPGFFGDLARFYCSGIFKGFDVRDVRRSPRLLNWLSHELSYGATQREYSRLWLSFLAAEEVSYDPRGLTGPVSFEEEWKQRLIHELGLVLFAKIKEDSDSGLELRTRNEPPESPRSRRPDFRFVNSNVVSLTPEADAPPGSLRYYVLQRVTATVFDDLTQDTRKDIARALRREEYELVLRLIEQVKRVAPVSSEPRDLFVLN
ncbi:hypothetical protein [Cystobacter ferrugineus]|uniref:Uncharacterized protein n=1 Tax=Cystobacter ferrugineus TaxID=83449 RepID=A0A1L9B5Q5_9BACT|nr:hypothetical protein [Cystobacter ferrugineus]OJH37576.1 hypothetical protein BON30_25580 [Cystobacter ferrugineus]